MTLFLLFAGLLFSILVKAQSTCSSVAPVTNPQAADGFVFDTIANNLTLPRGIIFDPIGRLLAVQQGVGVVALTLSNETCASVIQTTVVLANSSLNHGLEFSPDGTTFYASSEDTAWAWNYNVTDASVSNPQAIVTNMGGTTLVTRTLHIPPAYPNLLIVSRGSNGNIDPAAANPASGTSQVKVFDLNNVPQGGYDYTAGGGILAYGTRNEVGVTSDLLGNVWGVDNSADNLTYNGSLAVSNDNPADELNYFGTPVTPQSLYFGFPNCFDVWDPTPFLPPLETGQRWTPAPNSTFNDTTCNSIALPARLSIMAHSAPLDIKFYYPPSPATCSNGAPNQWGSFPCSWNSTAFVSFHGSWDSNPPTGYKVVSVPWLQTPSGSVANVNSFGPVGASNSQNGYNDLLYMPQVESGGPNSCPEGCTRPVGLAFDSWGRLYVSSDSSGEIFRIRYVNADETSSAGSTSASATTSPTGSSLPVLTSLGSKNSLSAFVLAVAVVLISIAW